MTFFTYSTDLQATTQQDKGIVDAPLLSHLSRQVQRQRHNYGFGLKQTKTRQDEIAFHNARVYDFRF
jgi:hypothetical protein